jgi:hypothetical protein
MQPLGYLYKRVALKPDWLEAPQVRDVYSLSGCMSEDFAEYIQFWKHNGFWLFDTPQIIEALAAEQSISLDGLRLFYYEAHELEYDPTEQTWRAYEPEASFGLRVMPPPTKSLEGFDVVSYLAGTSPECSPLSCNNFAAEVPTNEHCLMRTFDEAREAIESGRFDNAEPGPYRIVAVYSVTPDAP